MDRGRYIERVKSVRHGKQASTLMYEVLDTYTLIFEHALGPKLEQMLHIAGEEAGTV